MGTGDGIGLDTKAMVHLSKFETFSSSCASNSLLAVREEEMDGAVPGSGYLLGLSREIVEN
jgi:hypothetical protein